MILIPNSYHIPKTSQHDLDVVGSAAVPDVGPSVSGSVWVLAADLKAGGVSGGVADGAVSSLRPDTGAVEVVGEMGPAVVVEGGDGAGGSGEELDTD